YYCFQLVFRYLQLKKITKLPTDFLNLGLSNWLIAFLNLGPSNWLIAFLNLGLNLPKLPIVFLNLGPNLLKLLTDSRNLGPSKTKLNNKQKTGGSLELPVFFC